MIIWNVKDADPEESQGMGEPLRTVMQAPPLSPTLRTRVQDIIEMLIPPVPFARVPPPSGAELTGYLATFLDLEDVQAQQLLQVLAAAPDSSWTPSGVPGLQLLLLTGGPHTTGATCRL